MRKPRRVRREPPTRACDRTAALVKAAVIGGFEAYWTEMYALQWLDSPGRVSENMWLSRYEIRGPSRRLDEENMR